MSEIYECQECEEEEDVDDGAVCPRCWVAAHDRFREALGEIRKRVVESLSKSHSWQEAQQEILEEIDLQAKQVEGEE